jgi:hypothetical protein
MNAKRKFDLEALRRTPLPPAPELAGPAVDALNTEKIGNGYKRLEEKELRDGISEAKAALDALSRLPCNKS